MASWARAGARVELLTVFACDPESEAPTKGWDARGGFRTEGDAARARREEDVRACAALGVSPVWLTFGSVDYDRHGDEQSVRESVVARLDGADSVLLPGHPLSHPDHAWLVAALEPVALDSSVGRYAEQPYTRRSEPAPTLVRARPHSASGSGREVAGRARVRLAAPTPRDAQKPDARGARDRVHGRGDLLAGGYAAASMTRPHESAAGLASSSRVVP